MRTGARMGDTKLIDMMVTTLTDPFGVGHIGITAENLVTKWGITREEQDALAVESHRKAAAAITEGRFKSQIVPIVKQTRKGEVLFDTDEHVKAGTTMESLGKLKPAFKKDGSVTASNSSGINDGAAFSCWPMRRWQLRRAICRWRVWCRMRLLACPTRSWAKGSDPGDQIGIEEVRSQARSDGRDRKQRSLRGAGYCCSARP